MKKTVLTAGALAVAAGSAQAGGIDRSGQGLGVLFEKGSYVEFSLGRVNPSVDGTDVTVPTPFGPLVGRGSGNVGKDYTQYSFALKQDINDKLSYAAIYDQPFGVDLLYPLNGSRMFGGTMSKTTETALTLLMRYKFDDNWSAYGGIRAQRASGDVRLKGLAYRSPLAPLTPGSGVDGYYTRLKSDYGFGWVIGGAYERPDIALRVSLNYQSKVRHELDTTEIFPGVPLNLTSVTKVDTPQSINLDIQTGIAPNWLAFGGIRWVNWSDFDIDPKYFTTKVNGGKFVKGGGLVNLDDTTTWTLGVGHKFSDSWSGAASFSYEKAGDKLVSPLSPSTGRKGITLAAVYTHESFRVTTGINYTMLGDANPETGTPDTARAHFKDNSSVGVGIRVGYSF